MSNSIFNAALQEHLALFNTLSSIAPQVEQAAAIMARCLKAGNKIMLCGNGGSAADSQHIAAELTGRFVNDRPALAGLALSTDSSALTCIGNDYGFADVFVRQVQGLGKAGDVLIAITTSGNSENILKAIAAANAMGITTIGWLGRDGGKAAKVCAHSIIINSPTTARIQEAHIFVGHNLCALIERELGFTQGHPHD
jgi:D-sedoheptulose 7-phosphate isomerase